MIYSGVKAYPTPSSKKLILESGSGILLNQNRRSLSQPLAKAGETMKLRLVSRVVHSSLEPIKIIGSKSKYLYLTMIRWACSRVVRRCIHSSASVPGIQTKFDLPDPTLAGSSFKTADGGWVPRLTKIVATIGPTSEQLPVLQEVRQMP